MSYSRISRGRLGQMLHVRRQYVGTVQSASSNSRAASVIKSYWRAASPEVRSEMHETCIRTPHFPQTDARYVNAGHRLADEPRDYFPRGIHRHRAMKGLRASNQSSDGASSERECSIRPTELLRL